VEFFDPLWTDARDFWEKRGYIPPESLEVLGKYYTSWERKKKESRLKSAKREVEDLEGELGNG